MIPMQQRLSHINIIGNISAIGLSEKYITILFMSVRTLSLVDSTHSIANSTYTAKTVLSSYHLDLKRYGRVIKAFTLINT